MKKNVLVYITGHGFGHLAQMSEVLIALYEKYPVLKFTICTSLPAVLVSMRINGAIPAQNIRIIPDQSSMDIGMVMHDAMRVDETASAAMYEKNHADWDSRIRLETKQLLEINPDIVLSNISYLPLAASARVGIPSVALCSLDWASVFQRYCSEWPGASVVYQQIVDAYNAANLFLQITPHLPMQDFKNCKPVGPVGRRGHANRTVLEAAFPDYAGERIGLVSMGGMSVPIQASKWPVSDGVKWVITDPGVRRADIVAVDDIPMLFSDLVASSDFIISKSGYGIVVEAAISGKPLLYLQRPDWPEEPGLFDWSKRHNRTLEISRENLERGDLSLLVEQVFALIKPEPPTPSGADACDHEILQLLSSQSSL